MRTSSRTKVPTTTSTTGPAISDLDYSFTLSMRAANLSAHTIAIRRVSLQQFVAFLDREQLSPAVDAISREHVERWLLSLQDAGMKPATVVTRFGSLRRFFAWCVEEAELHESPMQRMREPKQPDKPRRVISEADLRRLLAACEGKDFYHRRDMAILRIFIDCGVRRAEMIGMQLADINWVTACIMVKGKGDKSRYIHLGKKALRALDSYRRVRAAHPHADLPDLWLSRQGRLGFQRLTLCISEWAERAGIEAHLHPHLFRHTWAHQWLEGGGQEQDMMELGGWQSPQVAYRYGKSLRASRAWAAHERLSPGDRL